MSKPVIALIIFGVIAFIVVVFIATETLMCEPPCV